MGNSFMYDLFENIPENISHPISLNKNTELIFVRKFFETY